MGGRSGEVEVPERIGQDHERGDGRCIAHRNWWDLLVARNCRMEDPRKEIECDRERGSSRRGRVMKRRGRRGWVEDEVRR